MMMNVAWARAHGGTAFLFPDASDEDTKMVIGDAMAQNHTLNKVLRERDEITQDKCASCSNFDFDRKYCGALQVIVMPDAHACEQFDQV